MNNPFAKRTASTEAPKWYRKRNLLLGAVLFLIAFRLYLPTLVKNYLNRQLNKDPVYRGSVEGVRLHILRGAYTILNLRVERVFGQQHYPFVSASETEIGVAWRELIHHSIVAKITVEDLVMNVVVEPAKNLGEGGKGKKISVGAASKQEKKEEVSNWHTVFKNLVPLNLSILKINGTSLHFRDVTKTPPVDVYLDELKVEGENLTNNRKSGGTLFGTLTVKARAMKSGALEIKVDLNPIATPSQFKFTLHLTDLNLVDLNPFFTAYGDFDVKKGRFNLYAEGASSNNKVLGYAKPAIQDLHVSDFGKDFKKGGLLHAFWEQIVGTIGSVFKNYSKDRQAAKIPFSGKLDAPVVDAWATFVSVLENMFIKPISASKDESVNLKDVKKVKR